MMPTRFISCVYCISVWNYCSNPDLYLPGFWVSGHNSCTCFLFDLGMDLPHLFHHIFFLRVMNLVLSKRRSAINPICRQEPGSERWRPAFEGIYPDTQARYPSGQVIAARTAQRCLKGVYFTERDTCNSWPPDLKDTHNNKKLQVYVSWNLYRTLSSFCFSKVTTYHLLLKVFPRSAVGRGTETEAGSQAPGENHLPLLFLVPH